MFGGVRFGGTLTIDSAFALGFDHIALCAGAGRPTIVPMKNGLAAGVRQASDFLMALQLTGAAKTDSLANLQVRLPVVIIGGGLTAIDTATEALAYYPLQVEKFLSRYETLVAERGETAVRADWTAHEAARRGRVHRPCARNPRRARSRRPRGPAAATRRSAAAAGAAPPSSTGGGWSIRRATRSTTRRSARRWRRGSALPSGSPRKRCCSTRSAGRALRSGSSSQAGEPSSDPAAPPHEVVMPARTILVAAGTQPNTVLGREEPQHVTIDGRYFQAFDEHGRKVAPERMTKPSAAHVLMGVLADGRAMSFFGDLHPSFAGNVVKAMASAKQGYPVISRMLARLAPPAVSPADR